MEGLLYGSVEQNGESWNTYTIAWLLTKFILKYSEERIIFPVMVLGPLDICMGEKMDIGSYLTPFRNQFQKNLGHVA